MGPIAAPAPFKVPVDLGTKRAPSFNAALGRAGLPVLTIPPPPAFARLTPMAPVTNGAKITEVGQSTYVGPGADHPDGLFIIDAAPPSVPSIPFPGSPVVMAINVPKGTLKMEFSVEGNKLYFVDCRSSVAASNLSAQFPSAPPPITFARTGGPTPQQVAAEDGHYIYPFRTTNSGPISTISVQLTFHQPSYFFGCELTRT
jgi:hypothetical protein